MDHAQGGDDTKERDKLIILKAVGYGIDIVKPLSGDAKLVFGKDVEKGKNVVECYVYDFDHSIIWGQLTKPSCRRNIGGTSVAKH